MFENAGTRVGVAEGAVAGHPAILTHLDDFARLDFAQEFRADHIQRHRFAGENMGIADLAHHQRANAQRIAAGNHPLGSHADQRIGTFHHPQCIDKPVEQGGIAAGGDQMDDYLGIRGRLEDRALVHQLVPQMQRVGDIAVVRDGKSAACQIGEQRLNIAQSGPAGGGITDMARCHHAGQLAEDRLVRKHLRNMADAASGIEFGAIPADNADGFLAAMLQSVKAKRHHRRGIFRSDHAKDAALLAQFVTVRVEERMRKIHGIA